jgi:hypothetical protein
MTWRSLAAGLLAGAGLLACAASADAGDTVRLKLTPQDDTPTFNLKGSGDADVIDVAHRGGFHGGYGHVGYHGYGHHGYGYHGYGHHGYGYHGYGHHGYGYRGYGYGYRGYAGFGYGYRSFYRGYYGYYPRYYGYYASYPYYYAAPYYYSPSLDCYPPLYPISDVTVATPSFSLRLGSTAAVESVPYPQLLSPDAAPRTYPYDGGPAVPVPLPKAAPEQLTPPRPLPDAPADRSVSLPASGGSKFAYPAYGDKPQKTQFAADRVEKKNDPVVKKTP